jgi:hypothetical protein
MPNAKSTIPEPATRARVSRFDGEFIERRFQLHRDLMAQYAAQLASDIVIEVAAAVDQARRELAAKRLPPSRSAA